MNTIQMLNAMFGYGVPTFDIEPGRTQTHRIGVRDPRFIRKEESVKPVKLAKDPNKLKDSEKRILMIVNCNSGVTGVDVAKKTKWTQNHCSIILSALHKKGLIRRVKRTGPHIRFYEYFKHDPA